MAAIEPRDTIEELDVCNTLLPSSLHATWALVAQVNTTCDQLERKTAAGKQFLDE